MVTPGEHTEAAFNFVSGAGNTFSVGRGNGIETEEDARGALLAGFKSELITAIKEDAQERIYAIVPAWKQSNLNARMNELNMIRFEREWNESELAEIAAMNAIWQQVKAIRAASTQAENEVYQLTTIDGILEL